MSSGSCSVCGRSGELQFGTDGLAYCSSCQFYGLNKQCFKCRMYLPATELQQYRGQWMCPYCVQDMRDADRHAEEYHAPDYAAQASTSASATKNEGVLLPKEHVEILSYSETCDRCGRSFDHRVYIWNGRKLCKKCLESEQENWGLVGGGPSGSAQGVSMMVVKKAKQRNFFDKRLSEILVFLRLKKREREVVVVTPKMPIKYAKPMAETRASGGKPDLGPSPGAQVPTKRTAPTGQTEWNKEAVPVATEDRRRPPEFESIIKKKKKR